MKNGEKCHVTGVFRCLATISCINVFHFQALLKCNSHTCTPRWRPRCLWWKKYLGLWMKLIRNFKQISKMCKCCSFVFANYRP